MDLLPTAFRMISVYFLSFPKNDGRRELLRQKKSEDTQTIITYIIQRSSFGNTGHFQETLCKISGNIE